MPHDTVTALLERGVIMPDPAQVFVDRDVVPDRIAAGVVLHPGTRLHGAATYLATGARVGTEGPATLRDAVLGERAEIASGYVSDAVLLADAKLGANAHVREGTLLEEEASTAHAVGLKQTILLSFVTLGSLINFCDVLMAGGTSRRDHSEVGSGFIHFNFTPWGKSGDKATASLIGDVVHGVLLDQPRIFLGGSGGMVGPRRVGFGAVTAAGQVVRRDVEARTLAAEPTPKVRRAIDSTEKDRVALVLQPNAAFLGQLVALRAWYRQVRVPRAPADSAARVTADAAVRVIDVCLAERWKRLAALVTEQGGRAASALALPDDGACPVELAGAATHVEWVRALDAAARQAIVDWLGALATDTASRVAAAARRPISASPASSAR
jgi:UDP-N-acetylglucosamine/UDP-N-acetylgalactosamine diphosphorylase